MIVLMFGFGRKAFVILSNLRSNWKLLELNESRLFLSGTSSLKCDDHSNTPIIDNVASQLTIPKPPPEGLCCGSGCQNCVWFVYAEELLEYHNDGGKMALEALKDVPDTNIREFLKMELKMKLKLS